MHTDDTNGVIISKFVLEHAHAEEILISILDLTGLNGKETGFVWLSLYGMDIKRSCLNLEN